MEFRMTEKGFQTDAPFGVLDVSSDENAGFRPYQLMVASLAGCSGSVLRKVLAKKRLSYEDIRIEAQVERNPQQADRIEKVHLHFTLKGNLDEEKVRKSLEVTKRNCSMVQSVMNSVEVTETFTIVHP